MNHHFIRTRRAIVVALCLGLLVVALGAMTASAANLIVTPSNPDGWGAINIQNGATAAITTDNPRDGLGSLKFDSPNGKADFEKQWQSARTLGTLSDVSFEYYRDGSSTTAAHFMPALRLLFWHDEAPAGLGAEDHVGYLIWEGIYNGINPAPTNSWQSENLFGDNFWMRYVGGPNNVGGCGKTIQNFNATLNDWLTGNPQGQPGDCVAPDLSADTYIYGVNTGVGSGWGGTFLGYVDNVVVAFGADVVSANFEPDPQCTTVCYADAVNGDDANDGITPATAKKTIQAAIDQVSAGGEVRVLPGNYSETATGRDVFGAGSYQFGLFFEETAKDGVTVVGVTAADVAITDPALTEAFVTTNATNSFGYSGIFVEADDVTIAGLEIGDNAPSNNKTIEVAGDGFTLKDSTITVSTGGAVYFGDWNYDELTGTAHIERYTITNNDFGQGGIVSINNGAGASGPVSGRQITGNTFAKSATQAGGSVVFTGDGTTVTWFEYPVGGAVITANSFTNLHPSGVHIMVRGMADDSEWDWESYWNDNTFNKAVIVGPNLFDDVRAYSYTSGIYTLNDVRQIGAAIQPEINHAQDGDTVLVNEGTYPESPNVIKSVTLVSDDGRDQTFIQLQPQTIAATYLGSLYIDAADVTVDGFTITGFDADCADFGVDGDQDDASTNIITSLNAETAVVRNNRFQVGAKGACTTYDDAIGVATIYTDTADTLDSLLVENNIFEPANATAGRAFYVNPGTVAFTFRGNTINGEFTSGSYTQAKDGLVENNTINGTGTSRGMGTWGYPDPTLYGATLFQGNTINDVVSGITIYGSENVTVTKNFFTGNGHAVWVDEDVTFDLSTIHINRNSIAGNDMGIENWYDTDVDGTCNWWGDASGPSQEGPGSGDPVGTFVDFTPWLFTDDLDGPCYIGGTITVIKEAGDVGDQFEFDPSWSDDNFLLYSGGSLTSAPLQAGVYSVAEVNLPDGWSLEDSLCEIGEGESYDLADPSQIPVEDGDEWVCTFTNVYTPPPSNICPAEYESNLWTDIIGKGMGSPRKHKASTKLTIPNYQNVEQLYGQMVAKSPGEAKYVRFILPGKNNYVQVDLIAGAPAHPYGNFWYGDYIDPAKTVTGRWFLQKSGVKNHIPRAMVLYPTYAHPTNTYVNVWNTFDPAEGEVYWDTAGGWTPFREIVVPIAPPNGPTTFNVELALVDNDKDNRPVWVTVIAGGVSQTQMPVKPTQGDQLNLMTFTLANVPAGTDEIVIEVYSPSMAIDGIQGDSATVVGMAANYQCAAIMYED